MLVARESRSWLLVKRSRREEFVDSFLADSPTRESNSSARTRGARWLTDGPRRAGESRRGCRLWATVIDKDIALGVVVVRGGLCRRKNGRNAGVDVFKDFGPLVTCPSQEHSLQALLH